VRLTGIVLLGSPRSEAADHAHESSTLMLGPIMVLVVLCLTVAIVPQTVASSCMGTLDQVLNRDSSPLQPELAASDAPLTILGNLNALTLFTIGVVVLGFLVLSRKTKSVEGPTWGCGFAKPTQRMQYTGRSFAELIAEHLLPRVLRPRITRQIPRGLF